MCASKLNPTDINNEHTLTYMRYIVGKKEKIGPQKIKSFSFIQSLAGKIRSRFTVCLKTPKHNVQMNKAAVSHVVYVYLVGIRPWFFPLWGLKRLSKHIMEHIYYNSFAKQIAKKTIG